MDPVAIARSHARMWAVGALLLGLVLGATALRLSDSGDDGPGVRLSEAQQQGTATPEPGATTSFRVASLNVLGAGHTGPRGRKSGWAPGVTRMERLTEVITNRRLDVIGLQEFERSQWKVFKRELGTTYGTYPGTAWGPKTMRNSVAWRLSDWELVSGSWVKVPYFHGILRRMPVVLLRNVETGQQAYVTSFHNPASSRGNAEKWRDRATAIQVALVNRLRTESGLPVYVTGDMNERDEYFCKMTRNTDMISASGGTNSARGRCAPARPTYIDWVFGSPETTFSSYRAARSPKIRRATDHPLILADAELPPVLTPPDCPVVPTPTGSATS